MPRKSLLQHSVFRDETAARKALENLRWPKGYRCPECFSPEVKMIGGEKQTHRAGLLRCGKCKRQFTVTVGTVFHRSKVPLTKWLQIIHLEDTPSNADSSWRMAKAVNLDFKTVERMRARIYAAVGEYKGPNTIFGAQVRGYVRAQRPAGYQRPPKLRRGRDGESLNYGPWYAWREKHPLEEPIADSGVLAGFDNARPEDLKRTERLLIQLLSAKPVPMTKKRRKSEKLPAPHLGWLKLDRSDKRT